MEKIGFPLKTNVTTREGAENLCNEEYLSTDDDALIPIIASIKSAAEQSFLAEFVFETSGVESNVWIGGKRIKNENNFVWEDGSLLQFTNWDEGSPSEQTGNECIEMQSYHNRDAAGNDSKLQSSNGLWKDVRCGVENYVVCEKLQLWFCSCFQIRRELRNVRTELRDFRKESEQSLDGVQNLLEGQQSQLEGQQNQLEGLKNQLEGLQDKLQSLQSQSEYQQSQLDGLERNPGII